MPTPVSDYKLEQFRQAAAGQLPTPAGVAVAAVTTAFALSLLAKVLTIGAHRKEPSGPVAKLESLAAAAQAASQRMLQLASDDSIAFEAYLTARRMAHGTDSERQARQRAMDSAIGRAIDLPLEAAQEASAGLQVCAQTSAATPIELAADLGVAVTLLAGALRGFLLCADSNVRQLASEAASYRERLATESTRHEQALRQAQALLESLKR